MFRCMLYIEDILFLLLFGKTRLIMNAARIFLITNLFQEYKLFC